MFLQLQGTSLITSIDWTHTIYNTKRRRSITLNLISTHFNNLLIDRATSNKSN